MNITLITNSRTGMLWFYPFDTTISLGFAQEATRLERAGVQAQQKFQVQQTEGLLAALQAGMGVKQLKEKAKENLTDSPASPLLALQTSLDRIRENRLEGLEGSVYQVAFSPNGDRIVSRGAPTSEGGDGTTRIWDDRGNQIAHYPLRGMGVLNSNWTSTALIQDHTPLNPAPGQVIAILSVDDLDGLIAQVCTKLHCFLVQNPRVSDSDRALCSIPPRN